MTNTTKNYIELYNNAMAAALASHSTTKAQTQIAYANAVAHGSEFGDWFLLADFINTCLKNHIATGSHLSKVLKTTNNGLVYNVAKKSIKQADEFDKTKTITIQNIWSSEFVDKTTKQMQAFTADTFVELLKKLFARATKNNIADDDIKSMVDVAVAGLNNKTS